MKRGFPYEQTQNPFGYHYSVVVDTVVKVYRRLNHI